MAKQTTKSSSFSQWKTLSIIPVIIAILVVVILVKSKSGPQQKEAGETSRVLRVMKVQAVDLIPRTVGYGIAEPAQVWRAVAEVRGRVVDVHPRLKAGALLKKDDLLLKTDPTEYELAVAVLQAGIAQTKADLSELAVQKENTTASLKIEKRSLVLAEQSLARKKSVFKKNSISANEVDQEERNVLIQRQRLQDLENSMHLIPSRKKALEAKLASNEVGLEQARIDLAKTVFTAPFDCRIGAVSIEPGQYLAAGQVLFEAHGTAVTEIEAQVLGEQLRHLIGVQNDSELQTPVFMEVAQRLINIKAIVRIRSINWNIEWEARVDRLRETVDPDTRAFNVIVAVDRPYEKVIPGRRPPLSRGLFCEVELQGPPRPESIVIPRTALHGKNVFILDADNRLQPVTVTTAFVQADLAVIDSGLTGGETLIVSDPTPAISGMLVTPVWEEELQKRLVTEARAKTVLQ